MDSIECTAITVQYVNIATRDCLQSCVTFYAMNPHKNIELSYLKHEKKCAAASRDDDGRTAIGTQPYIEQYNSRSLALARRTVLSVREYIHHHQQQHCRHVGLVVDHNLLFCTGNIWLFLLLRRQLLHMWILLSFALCRSAEKQKRRKRVIHKNDSVVQSFAG